MPAINNRVGGTTICGCEPMIPASGPNIAPNTNAVPNVANYFIMGGNILNIQSIRSATSSTGSINGAASGTNSGMMQPINGSVKYLIQGSPITRLGDIGTVNTSNSIGTQAAPSQTKYFILS